ncbi:class I SAM-dependent DNA methyltransferase [candidate division KSB1 bacterium]
MKTNNLLLYSELADVYDKLYSMEFDYKKDMQLFEQSAKKYNLREVLELGCGTGHLTKLLVEKGYNVTGVDLYDEMLRIAKEKLPDVPFIQSDIRNLNLEREFKSAVLLGRTITYMLTNRDVEECVQSIYRCLKTGGIFILDSLSAPHFVKNLKEKSEVTQSVNVDGQEITRISSSSWNLKHGLTFDWKARYFIKKNNAEKEITDISTIRAFWPEELEYYLKRAGFGNIELIDKESLFIIIAQK